MLGILLWESIVNDFIIEKHSDDIIMGKYCKGFYYREALRIILVQECTAKDFTIENTAKDFTIENTVKYFTIGKHWE